MSTHMKPARGDGKGSERISRDMLQMRSLSLKARGLLSLLKSLPENWDCGGVDGIVKHFCDKDGAHAVSEAIKELEAHGLFARLKRQGEGGKWNWLWTYADYPDEVVAEVRRWEVKGYQLNSKRGGNTNAKPPTRDVYAGQSMLAESEHGPTVFGGSIDGQSVDGGSPNKEGLFPPSEEETFTQHVEHTPREAAPPPCVVDNPVVVEFPDEIQLPVDPDEVQAAYVGTRPRAANRATARWNNTARSADADRLVRAFVANRVVPKRTRDQLGVEVTGLLAEGIAEEFISQGMAECLAKGIPPSGLANFVAAVANRVPDGGRPRKAAPTDVKVGRGIDEYLEMPGATETRADVMRMMFPNLAAEADARRGELEDSTSHPSSSPRALPSAGA